ncbi:hypothetical protein SPHINGO391_220036 [Sphingomonas aurantiaca]|uniref:Uncharacterized protein n=1 Tax=Sphingomonas aurantiaca TaxID=185949 RepID=A0A5E7XV24_9SPHN|nr:hypothetical protein SPHINGO391_220036 [Sphingomonas aurantiaca]
MVAEQEQGLCGEVTQALQPLDDTCGIRAAVDKVAKEDDCRGLDGAVGDVVLDATEKFIYEIKPAMDVADRVEALVLGTGKATRRRNSRRHAAEQLREHMNLERRCGRPYDGRPACM